VRCRRRTLPSHTTSVPLPSIPSRRSHPEGLAASQYGQIAGSYASVVRFPWAGPRVLRTFLRRSKLAADARAGLPRSHRRTVLLSLRLITCPVTCPVMSLVRCPVTCLATYFDRVSRSHFSFYFRPPHPDAAP
jgi:hypothetical protein